MLLSVGIQERNLACNYYAVGIYEDFLWRTVVDSAVYSVDYRIICILDSVLSVRIYIHAVSCSCNMLKNLIVIAVDGEALNETRV